VTTTEGNNVTFNFPPSAYLEQVIIYFDKLVTQIGKITNKKGA